MSRKFSEDYLVEESTREVLQEIGWHIEYAWGEESFGEDGLLRRDNRSEVILTRYLRNALETFNPNLPESAYSDAIGQISEKFANKSLIQINKEKYDLFKNGVSVKYVDSYGVAKQKRLQVFNFKDPYRNNFLTVRQLEVSGELYNRRPDIVGFVNGIPLILFELKAPNKDLKHAFTDNLLDYKDTIPELFHSNAFVVLSNGRDSRVGTITSPYNFFHEWKRIDEEDAGQVSLDTMLRGVCEPGRFMDLFEIFSK